ncbi:ribonucleotide reductase [Oleiphilus sp. HI0009]|uniref:ribonucleotide-diphosphate reductase subunit beta n=3 Tax=Oleiphilus TaxID=141450 RepID=UPI0007C3FA17|nr:MULTISPECIES: ribonucleotide-diphosphate reductase subunit beta [unclassified Oleiphilus]KZX76290.1 ribonucleotide reductase [Oleiphilus sp. HI0009]MCH2157585.1 ribonucleotide-diphosphate reductase subunit beta [Oleiphilaceae bacterium]KZX82783.1 ribonucleotide reductase [Oleiphilus sp. HI0009]KZY61434.1 ribonucleotide reductase [Oleiphilus sp. HI0066]KZY64950.1 ribonucleotide reductase [Oleiphilus sp. HI0066]
MSFTNKKTSTATPNWDDPLAAAIPSQAQPSIVTNIADHAKEEEFVLEALPPVRMEDKRVVNGEADVNQLAPFKYPWAWQYFLNANKNHWTPLDVNMSQDVHDYHHKLTVEERHVFENVLAYLTTSDILAMRNIGLAVMEKMSAPELQIYQARQVFEEAMHTWTYQHCIETIGLDQSEIYNRYRVVPEIYSKIRLANRRLNAVLTTEMDLKNRDDLEQFMLSYTFFAGVFEGCWFYNGFSPIFALQRRGLMKGTAEQLQYIMRDEVMHAAFGIKVVKQIMVEENISLDPKAVKLMWEESEAAEKAYAGYLLRDPILGYTAEDHVEQFRFIANRRAKQLKLEQPFPGAQNALPWLDEQAALRKEKNFFETRVTEYQTGASLSW